jgi:uncharacterized protein (DUF2237 family)
MDELKLTGNCLKGSRPLLSFDKVRPGDNLANCVWITLLHVGKVKITFKM